MVRGSPRRARLHDDGRASSRGGCGEECAAWKTIQIQGRLFTGRTTAAENDASTRSVRRAGGDEGPKRQTEREGGAFPELALDVDRAAVSLGDLARHVEPQAQAAEVRCRDGSL